MTKAALAELDSAIEAKRAELDALVLARQLLAGDSPPVNGAARPLGNGSSKSRRRSSRKGKAPKFASGPCDKAGAGDGRCGGEIRESSCVDCGLTARRCQQHGGGKAAGGTIAGHRRHGCSA